MTPFRIEPLSKEAFRDFGEVIETAGAEQITINQGYAERYNDLVRVDVAADGGLINVSIVTANPRPLPLVIKLMERHPLGSQIFLPLQDRTWLVVVAHDPKEAGSYRVFSARGQQGVNYARNVWHHPLLVFDRDSRFVVVDRKGPGDNLEEVWLEEGKELLLTP